MTAGVDVLLYFAPVAWDSYPQRPHYFVRHFLKRDRTRVVWVDPYPIRLPTFADLRRIRGGPRISLERPPALSVVSLRTLPLEPWPIGRWLNGRRLCNALARRIAPVLRGATVRIGIGRPSALALSALDTFQPVATFYDAMDDFPEFYHGVSKESVRAQERDIARRVDVVVTPASSLWTKFKDLGSRRIMIHNAFEMARLPARPHRRPGPRVLGYVGCIGHWFDWTIVERLARELPDNPVHIVGPCFSKPPHRLPSNVVLFPACPLEVAIEHCETFSVGLIPFKRTPLTEGVDPIKYYKYRAMGLPVLTTAFGEMARRGIDDGAFTMDSGPGLRAAATAALEAHIDSATVERFRREHTWERRFAESGVLDRALGWDDPGASVAAGL